MKITYSFASRSRPLKFFAALDNIRSMSASDNYEVIAKIDLDDKTFTQRFIDRLSQYPEVKVKFGKSISKVHAINRDLQDMTGNILCCHSDDMTFIRKGFDNDIRLAFKLHDGLLHFPDGYANERVCTYSIMAVEYYRIFGYIYHPDYYTAFCDDEATQVAKILGRYKYVGYQIFEHEHPVRGLVQKDHQYIKNDLKFRHDRELFLKRKRHNFEITINDTII